MTAAEIAAKFDGFCEREDWAGHGYLGLRDDLGCHATESREWPGKPAVTRRVDRAVAQAAADLGWTDEMLFHWTNSKMGRWYAEDGGDYRRTSTARRDYFQALDSLRASVDTFDAEIPGWSS